MLEPNKLKKANLIKNNWIKRRDAQGCFMAITTPIEESNNSAPIEESDTFFHTDSTIVRSNITL